MKNLMFVSVIAMVLLTSCEPQPFIAKSAYSESVVYKGLDYSSKRYEAPFKYFQYLTYNDKFIPSYGLYVKSQIKNNTGQLLEEALITPYIKLTFSGDNFKTIEIPSLKFSDLALKKGDNLLVQQQFDISSARGYNSQFLLHKIEKAELFFKIEGSNSVSSSPHNKSTDLLVQDISDQWNRFRDFEKSMQFQSVQEVFSSYPRQLATLQAEYNLYLMEYQRVINAKLSQNGNRALDFEYDNLISGVLSVHDKYAHMLYTVLREYRTDLTGVDGKITNEFDKKWNGYLNEYDKGLRIKRLAYERLKRLYAVEYHSPTIEEKQSAKKDIDSLNQEALKQIRSAVKQYSDAMKDLAEHNDLNEVAKRMKLFDKQHELE